MSDITSKSEKPSRIARPTMTDIARIADVDISTVSRALAGSSRVTEETRERILKIVEETGYVVNHGARMLRHQTAGKILVLLPNIAAVFFPEVVLGVEETMQKAGMSVVIGSTQLDPAREDALARQLLSGAADGIILLTGKLPGVLQDFPGIERRVVAVSRLVTDADLPYVNIDNEAAMQTAIGHLVSLGYQQIAHLAGPLRSPTSQARVEGYKKTMQTAGLADHIRVEAGDYFGIEEGRLAMQRILASGPRPRAIACASDDLAMGAIRYCREIGLRVPEDIAFMGFDDIPFASVYEPPLTTIRTPRRKMGELGAQMLLKNLKQAASRPKNVIVEHELIVRRSCGANP